MPELQITVNSLIKFNLFGDKNFIKARLAFSFFTLSFIGLLIPYAFAQDNTDKNISISPYKNGIFKNPRRLFFNGIQ